MQRRPQKDPLGPGRPRGAYPIASAARRLPLDAWVAVPPGPTSPGASDTVLRSMASSYGMMRGLAAVCLGTSGVLVAGSILAVLTETRGPAPWLLLAAAVLGICGIATLRGRTVRGVPSDSPAAYRGAGTVSSGVGAGLMMGAVLSAIALPLTASSFQEGAADVAAALALHALIIAQALCVFAIPAWFVQHAVRDFRAAVLRDPDLYASLDQLSRTWDAPYETREFGPL